MALDAKANFAIVNVLAYYGATDTQILVDDTTKLPAAPFNATWYNDNVSKNPALDPAVEIVRVTSVDGGSNTLTLANSGGNRIAQEGTTASAKNSAGGLYKLVVGITAKDFNDISAMAVDVGAAYAWVTEHGAVGDGTADDRAALQAAIDAGRKTIVFPAGTYRVASNITFASDTTLVLQAGALLAPDVAITITVNGDVQAGNHAISTGAGTVTLGARAVLRRDRWLGGTADQVTAAGDVSIEGADLLLRGTRISTGTAAPVSGTWAIGDIVLNSAPTTGEPLFWRCTAAGTPGTWEELPKGGSGSTITTLQSAEFAADAVVFQRLATAHGLGSAPALKDIQVTIVVSSGFNPSDAPGFRAPIVETVDATNIQCSTYVSDAGAIGTNARFAIAVKTA